MTSEGRAQGRLTSSLLQRQARDQMTSAFFHPLSLRSPRPRYGGWDPDRVGPTSSPLRPSFPPDCAASVSDHNPPSPPDRAASESTRDPSSQNPSSSRSSWTAETHSYGCTPGLITAHCRSSSACCGWSRALSRPGVTSTGGDCSCSTGAWTHIGFLATRLCSNSATKWFNITTAANSTTLWIQYVNARSFASFKASLQSIFSSSLFR
ncbi:unnamed protein product [Coccothraustes coccothraustes]